MPATSTASSSATASARASSRRCSPCWPTTCAFATCRSPCSAAIPARSSRSASACPISNASPKDRSAWSSASCRMCACTLSAERLRRMLKSLDAKGMIDPDTGLLGHEAFWRDLNRAVDDAEKRGVGLSIARFSFAHGDRRLSLDAARLVEPADAAGRFRLPRGRQFDLRGVHRDRSARRPCRRPAHRQRPEKHHAGAGEEKRRHRCRGDAGDAETHRQRRFPDRQSGRRSAGR